MNTIRFFLYLLLGSLLFHASYAAKLTDNESRRITGKPHAPVEMNYVLPDKISAAKKMNIQVSLIATQEVEALDVSLRFDEGMEAVSKQQLNFGRVARKGSQQFEIECLPQRNGLFYVHLLVTLTRNGQPQSRSFVIPVNVGNVDVRKHLKTPGVVSQDPGGERILSMPAQESRKPAK